MKKLIIASNNNGKIREFHQILGSIYELSSMKENNIFTDIPENGTTFEQNALIKANYIHNLTGQAAIADDSGLMVDALNGLPGVYSARFSDLESVDGKIVLKGDTHDDDANNAKLLQLLKDKDNRKAKYVSCIALVDGEHTFIARGECEGEILTEPHGNQGFGYDPYFYSYDINMCFGLASAEQKNKVSHRARALNNLLEQIKNA